MKRGQSPDEVDDDITEFGVDIVRAGLHLTGFDPLSKCKHEWVEVEDVEPPYDVCSSCGESRY